jgi:hypothetical protein
MIVGADGRYLENKGYPLMRLRALSQYEGHADANVLCREEEDGSLDLAAGRSEDYGYVFG